jgi:hypothetical protein
VLVHQGVAVAPGAASRRSLAASKAAAVTATARTTKDN